MKRAPTRMLSAAVLLVLAYLLAELLGADAGLEALTGMSAEQPLRSLAAFLYALAWIGAVGLAPVLAGAGGLWLALRRLDPRA